MNILYQKCTVYLGDIVDLVTDYCNKGSITIVTQFFFGFSVHMMFILYCRLLSVQ